jgi:hypothetical protein
VYKAFLVDLKVLPAEWVCAQITRRVIGQTEIIMPVRERQEILHTVPVKSLDTPTHSRVFIYFYYFIHCRTIMKTSKL